MPGDQQDLSTRVAVVETRQEALERVVEALEADVRETRGLVSALDAKLDSKFQELNKTIFDALKTAAEQVPPRLAWGIAVALTIAGLIIGVLGGKALHLG